VDTVHIYGCELVMASYAHKRFLNNMKLSLQQFQWFLDQELISYRHWSQVFFLSGRPVFKLNQKARGSVVSNRIGEKFGLGIIGK